MKIINLANLACSIIIIILLIASLNKVSCIEKSVICDSIVESMPMEQSSIDTVPHFKEVGPEEGLMEALEYYNIKCKNTVAAQARLESGHFRDDICIINNNLFGLKATERTYKKFDHWWDSVKDYAERFNADYKESYGDYIYYLTNQKNYLGRYASNHAKRVYRDKIANIETKYYSDKN